MSLKAKIEAVIYASEEPVTLAQLAGLLGLEAQAELDRREAGQQTLALDLPTPEADPYPPDPDSAEPAPEPPAPAAENPEPDPAAPPSFESAPVDDAIPHPDPTRLASREDRDRARRLRIFFRSLLDELIADYASADRGLEIREVASGFRIATKPEYHDAVRGFVKSLKPPLRLSLQALETLAVVAYKQPVTAPEIADIRGVDSGGVLGSLMARKLIATAGRKQVIGRPILYKTTRDFLLRFGLKDLNDLPSIEEFEKMAGDLADPEPTQEEIPMSVSQPEPEPQPDGDTTPLNTPAPIHEDQPASRLATPPPASLIPGTDDDPTESPEIADQDERDRIERSFPQEGSIPSLEPK